MVDKKKINQEHHTRVNAMNRHGLDMTSRMYSDLVKLIKNGGKTYYMRLTNTRSLHVVEYNGTVLPLIYDKKRKSITTVLPIPYYLFGEIP